MSCICKKLIRELDGFAEAETAECIVMWGKIFEAGTIGHHQAAGSDPWAGGIREQTGWPIPSQGLSCPPPESNPVGSCCWMRFELRLEVVEDLNLNLDRQIAETEGSRLLLSWRHDG